MNLDITLRIIVGVLCIPVSLLLLYVLYHPVFDYKRWHRTGLWLFSLGYAVLALGTLGGFLGFEERFWIVMLADVALVTAPCVILLSYALNRMLFR